MASWLCLMMFKQEYNLCNVVLKHPPPPRLWWIDNADQKNNSQVAILDILGKKSVNTDIYYKLTDSKSYLLYFCHPRHTKTNIPCNLARR